jgi:hypothetical protein
MEQVLPRRSPLPFPDWRPCPGPRLIPIDRGRFPVLPGDVLRWAPTHAEMRQPRPSETTGIAGWRG